MISLLSKIWCVISHLDCYLVYGGKAVINAVVIALGAAANAVLNAIPVDIPAPPAFPDAVTEVLSWIAWVFPVHTVYLIMEFFVTAWIMWQIVVIILRWVKAHESA